MRLPRFSLFDLFACITGLAVAAGISRLVWHSIRSNTPRPDVPIDEAFVAWIGLQMGIGIAAPLLLTHRKRISSKSIPCNLGELNWFLLIFHGAVWTAVLILVKPSSDLTISSLMIGLSCLWSLASVIDLIVAKSKRQLSPHRLVGDFFALVFGWPMIAAITLAILWIST